MKLEIEEGHYYLMEEGNDLAIATTDESFIEEIGARRLLKKNCDQLDIEKDVVISTNYDSYGYLILKNE